MSSAKIDYWRTYTHTHSYMSTCTYICTCSCIDTYEFIHIYLNRHRYIYMHRCTYTHVHIYIYVYTYICTYTYEQRQTRTYTYTYIPPDDNTLDQERNTNTLFRFKLQRRNYLEYHIIPFVCKCEDTLSRCHVQSYLKKFPPGCLLCQGPGFEIYIHY